VGRGWVKVGGGGAISNCPGLKISFTGPSDKMSGDVEFGSDICPMT
jgi:hypothetical protein